MVRQAYTLREADDDFGQAGTLVREVWNDEIRANFVKTVAGHLLGGVEGDVLERAFEYWKNVDADTGKKIEELVREGVDAGAPGAQPGEARSDASSPVVEDATHAGK
ncbi:MAG: catalase, partial [Marmoricola sp.]|nr:catalase [Marmoricola sp.]